MAEVHDVNWQDHNDFAQQIEQRDKDVLKFKNESGIVGALLVDVTTSSSGSSSLSTVLGEPGQETIWSSMPHLEPKESTQCFSSEGLIPSIGDQQTLLTLKEKFEQLVEEEKEDPLYNTEAKKLAALINELADRNKDGSDISNERHRYKRE